MAEHRLMAKMHPIEITDGGNTASVFTTQIVETANNLHPNAVLCR
jgi:hypothetical protein